MESQELENDKNLFHFIKMNIFGDLGVGKSTFISFLEDFKNENFEIMNKSNSSFDDSIEISENLVEQIKKIEVPIYDDRNIHFLKYEIN